MLLISFIIGGFLKYVVSDNASDDALRHLEQSLLNEMLLRMANRQRDSSTMYSDHAPPPYNADHDTRSRVQRLPHLLSRARVQRRSCRLPSDRQSSGETLFTPSFARKQEVIPPNESISGEVTPSTSTTSISSNSNCSTNNDETSTTVLDSRTTPTTNSANGPISLEELASQRTTSETSSDQEDIPAIPTIIYSIPLRSKCNN